MRKIREVNIRTCRTDVAVAAQWIREISKNYNPKRRETILTQGSNFEEKEILFSISKILEKAALRKHKNEFFSIKLEERLARYIDDAILHSKYIDIEENKKTSFQKVAIERFSKAVTNSIYNQIGRPNSTTNEKLKRLSSDYIMIQPRQKKRIKAQIKAQLHIDAQRREWAARIHARGETILTTPEFPPNFTN